VTVPLIIFNIVEDNLDCLGNSTSEKVRNVLMIYLAERGYLRKICQGCK
jgi:hypothetical protein